MDELKPSKGGAREIKWLGLFLLGINLFGFLMMGLDKRRAKNKKMRIDEGVLLVIAVAFGSLGVFIGSRVFHHKTRVKTFSFTLPVLILLHLSWLWLYSLNFLNSGGL